MHEAQTQRSSQLRSEDVVLGTQRELLAQEEGRRGRRRVYLAKVESAYGAAALSQDFWPKSVLQAVFLPLRNVDGAWPGYERIRGRLLRAPILRAFSDARAPDETRAWALAIGGGDWPFERIVSAPFASPIRASPAEFLQAFGAVMGDGTQLTLEEADWAALDALNGFIEENKLGSPLRASYR